MITTLVEFPEVNATALRVLVEHAKNPKLLRDTPHGPLVNFSYLSPFYEDFIALVDSRGYGSKKLEHFKGFIRQNDFKLILDCFKELSGLKNPLYYNYLGRIIPSQQDTIQRYASLTFGPESIIRLSPGYNRKLNNDQAIALEILERKNRSITSTIQHYFLPRNKDEHPYLEMITIGLGYWEGIPSLWGDETKGTTKISALQQSLEHLISHDFKYLNLNYKEDCKNVYINDVLVGEHLDLRDSLASILGFSPRNEFLVGGKTVLKPVKLFEDFEILGEKIFEKGIIYGAPCNRYTIEINNIPSLFKRWFGARTFSKKRKLMEDLWQEKKESEEERARAEAETQRARADTAEKEVALQKERAEKAEAKLKLTSELSGTGSNLEAMIGTAHQIKNLVVTQEQKRLTYLKKLSELLGYEPLNYHVFENNTTDALLDLIKATKENQQAPEILRLSAEYILDAVGRDEEIILKSKKIMQGNLHLEIQDLAYQSILGKVIDTIKGACPSLQIDYTPFEGTIRGDRELLEDMFFNIITNAAEASSPCGELFITASSLPTAERMILETSIMQTGMLPKEKAYKLNHIKNLSAEQIKELTTKGVKGNSVGAAYSYYIAKAHHGSIRYFSYEGRKPLEGKYQGKTIIAL